MRKEIKNYFCLLNNSSTGIIFVSRSLFPNNRNIPSNRQSRREAIVYLAAIFKKYAQFVRWFPWKLGCLEAFENRAIQQKAHKRLYRFFYFSKLHLVWMIFECNTSVGETCVLKLYIIWIKLNNIIVLNYHPNII